MNIFHIYNVNVMLQYNAKHLGFIKHYKQMKIDTTNKHYMGPQLQPF